MDINELVQTIGDNPKLVTHYSLIYDRIKEISNVSGSNLKKEILIRPFGDATTKQYFIQYLDYVFNEVKYTYHLKQIPEYMDNGMDVAEFSDLFAIFEEMNSNTGGEEIKQQVASLLAHSDYHINMLFRWVLDRSIDAGINSDTVAKLIPELEHLIAPYMRCEKEVALDKRIKYPCYAQIKADGLFINIFLEDEPRFITRYGNQANIKGKLFDYFKNLVVKNPLFLENVLMGELLVRVNGVILPREVGNGFINSLLKRESTTDTFNRKLKEAKTEKAKQKLINDFKAKETKWAETEENIIVKYWDMVSITEFKLRSSKQYYSDRISEINSMFDIIEPSILCLPILTRVVKSKKEIYDFFEEVLALGEEGLVVKNLDLTWCHDVNRGGIIKLKDFKDADLICIGYNPGDGEYTGGIGSLICRTSDSLVLVDPSSGLSMEQRGLERVDMNDSSKGWQPIQDFDLDQYNGKIIAIKYNSIMQEDDNGIRSLFLPKIEEIRESYDKQEADSLAKLLEG